MKIADIWLFIVEKLNIVAKLAKTITLNLKHPANAINPFKYIPYRVNSIYTRNQTVKMPHHHHHGDDHGCHGEAGHDHSNDITPALQSLLYKQVDFDKIVTMNESEPKAGAAIVKKTWDQRLDEEPQLESDADEQLLMHVPSVIPLAYPSYKPYSPNNIH